MIREYSPKRNLKNGISTVLVCALLAACGGGGGGDAPAKDSDVDSQTSVKASSAVKTSTVTNTNVCPAGGVEIGIGIDENANGQLDNNEIDSTEIVCHGTDGANGFDSLIEVVDEAAGQNCLNGGVQIMVGQDDNDDNTLEIDEISGMKYICHGLDGNASQRGFSSLIESTDEVLPSECANGGIKLTTGLDINDNGMIDLAEVNKIEFVCNGLNGLNGANSLIATYLEEPGANCTNGGARFDSGLDDNFNGVLDEVEVKSSQYLCHGEQGEQGEQGESGENGANGESGLASLVDTLVEPVGVNCPEGGVQIVTGLDLDSNGTLSLEERTNSAYVCHGMDPGGDSCVLVDDVMGGKVLRCGDEELIVELPPLYDELEITEITHGYRIEDSWASSGNRNAFDPRNPLYVFEVTETGTVDYLTAGSAGISAYAIIMDSEWFYMTSGSGYSGDRSIELEAGTYYMSVAPQNMRTQASFSIELTGAVANVRKVAVQNVEISDEWTSSRHSHASFQNPQYTFDIDRESDFAVDVFSNDGVDIHLTDEDGIRVTSSYGAMIRRLDAGSYTLVIANDANYQNESLVTRLTGQISNLAISEFTKETVENTITDGGGRDRFSLKNHAYTLTITEDSEFNLEMFAGIGRYLAIVDSLDALVPGGTSYGTTGATYAVAVDVHLEAGEYTIVVGTYSDGESGDYELELVGQFSNLTQIR